MEELLRTFAVEPEGEITKYSDTLSLGRCRIFYKGKTRNHTYITDEFAEKLLASLPYAPVKGIYADDDEDFTGHGKRRDEGRIYGVVPAQPNITWEDHVDSDGITRTYACCDVLYYTGLYKEAAQISKSSQSMELYADSIRGDWQYIDGVKYFVYTEGSFLGLQVLGKDVEPCFEGAEFYSVVKFLQPLLDAVKEYNLAQGGQKMENNETYRLSLNDIQIVLNKLLNPENADEESYVRTVYTDYAVVYKCKSARYERVYYTTNAETNEVTIDRTEECFILDVTADEMTALENLKKVGCNSFVGLENYVNELSNAKTQLEGEVEQSSSKISEFETTIATLNTEKDSLSIEVSTLKGQNEELTASIATLQNNCNELSTYKHNRELADKKQIVNNYIDILSEDVIATYTNALDDYSKEDLDMRLTYECKKANPALFSKNPDVANYVAKDHTVLSGIESILSAYERK